MDRRHAQYPGWHAALGLAIGLVLLSSCGGSGDEPTKTTAGVNKTYLTVSATDADGDSLHYQWRVTGGSIENRDSNQTVWTMPDGPGLHFAYVTVSDGHGGYVQQQYSASTDTLGTDAPTKLAIAHASPATFDPSGNSGRLRISSPVDTRFCSTPGSAACPFPADLTAQKRTVYLPDVIVQLVDSGKVVFSGVTDVSGELSLPKFTPGHSYSVLCTTVPDAIPVNCDSGQSPLVLTAQERSDVILLGAPIGAGRNLHLFGHLALTDGGVCGVQDEFFGLQSAATVQLVQSDGQSLTGIIRVNRFGDYALDASVAAGASLQLHVHCEAYDATIPVRSDPSGYSSARPVELSAVIPNSRPVIVKLVANGPDGNVRGAMVVIENDPDALSTGLPGPKQFLSYKGNDTRMSACRYYTSLGAAGGCDAQGGMTDPISFDDWKRKNFFGSSNTGNVEVSANYVNKMDLNLARRMVATKLPSGAGYAFYVCNSPGPLGTSQDEVDQVMDTALADLKRVACVAMESSVTPGVNGDQPFTKFFTFGPDGSLLASVNLDTRGEKFLPGACVACHGGTQYNGHFPDKGVPSPFLGSKFLPFDSGNYLFSSKPELSEIRQGAALKELNQYVKATETSSTSSTSLLIEGWYKDGTTVQSKVYVPAKWQVDETIDVNKGAAEFYRQVIGTTCRTCHTSLGDKFDWDSTAPSDFKTNLKVQAHFCGGTPDVAINASMPNALISRDRLADRAKSSATVSGLMNDFLSCTTPKLDPVYPKR